MTESQPNESGANETGSHAAAAKGVKGAKGVNSANTNAATSEKPARMRFPGVRAPKPLLSREAEVLALFYRKTAGDPIRATQRVLAAARELEKRLGIRFEVRRAGTTGSGRKMRSSPAMFPAMVWPIPIPKSPKLNGTEGRCV